MKKCLSGSLRKGEKLSEAYFFSVFKLFLINVLFISVCLARHFRIRFEPPRYFKCSVSYNSFCFDLFPGYSHVTKNFRSKEHKTNTPLLLANLAVYS